MARSGDTCYVIDVIRRQVEAAGFAKDLRALRNRYKVAPFLAIIGGTEKGTVSLLNSSGLAIEGVPATADKFVRAQAVSAAWNSGKVLVPQDAEWLHYFISEVCGFTGVNDYHDDMVDALVGSHLALTRPPPRRVLSNLAPG